MIVSSLFLLASICMLILSTIPEFQESLKVQNISAVSKNMQMRYIIKHNLGSIELFVIIQFLLQNFLNIHNKHVSNVWRHWQELSHSIYYCLAEECNAVTKEGNSKGGENDGRLLIGFYHSAVTGNRKQVLTGSSGSCEHKCRWNTLSFKLQVLFES